MESMKILVTGGAGFIGTNTCLEAKMRGHDVVAFDNLVRPRTEENIDVLRMSGVRIVRGDIRNKIDFDKLPWVPDGIIHLAGQCGIPYSLVSPYYDFEVNTLGTLNVLEYSRLHGKIPVAFASSNKTYTNVTNILPVKENKTRYEWTGEPMTYDLRMHLQFYEGIPSAIKESMPLDGFGAFARSPYGTSKVAADLYCQEYYQCFNVPTVIFRMSCIYGYYQKGVEDQAWVSWFLNQIAWGNREINIFGNGKQVRDMLFGEDCARLYLDAIENIGKVAGKPYNIGGGPANTMSLLEAISCIESLTGKKAKLTFQPKRHGDQDIWISDISKIKQDLGWEPVMKPELGIEAMLVSKI